MARMSYRDYGIFLWESATLNKRSKILIALFLIQAILSVVWGIWPVTVFDISTIMWLILVNGQELVTKSGDELIAAQKAYIKVLEKENTKMRKFLQDFVNMKAQYEADTTKAKLAGVKPVIARTNKKR